MEQRSTSGPDRAKASREVESLGILAGSKAGLALGILIALNLLNYVDRYLLAGAQPVIQRTLHASDASLGALSSWFFIAYMVAAPLVGWLGDRLPRRILVPGAVLWWSCALYAVTFGSNFKWIPYAYILVGVGEAAFGVFAIAMVSDYYTGPNRSRALSLFFLAMNGGRALGVPLGGWLAVSFGWQVPFRVMAAVGLLLGLLGFSLLFEPGSPEEATPDAGPSAVPRSAAFRALLNRGYVCSVLGLAMENFALGGLAVWLPTYLYRFAGYSIGGAAGVLGVITLTCGIGGTWLGGAAGARLLLRDRRGLYWLSAGCFAIAAPCVVAILTHSRWAILSGVVGFQLFLYFNLGPINTAVLNSVPAAVRSMGVAIALFVIHALGDAISPRLIGVISDAHGLRAGLSVTIVALLLGALLMLGGAQRGRSREQANP